MIVQCLYRQCRKTFIVIRERHPNKETVTCPYCGRKCPLQEAELKKRKKRKKVTKSET